MDDYVEKDQEFDNLEETIRKLVSMKISIIGLILPNLNLVETTKEMYEIIKKVVEENQGNFTLLTLQNFNELECFMNKNLNDEILEVYSK